MLNFLRADLYRYRHARLLFWSMLAAFAVPAFTALLPWILRAIEGSNNVIVMGQSVVDMTANLGFTGGFMPLLSAFTIVSLVAADKRDGALKNVLLAPTARRDYILSKIIVSVLTAFLVPAVMMLSWTAVPMLLQEGYEQTPALAEALWWLGFAMLVCFAYNVIALLVAVWIPGETMTWLIVVVLLFGMLGDAVAALGALAEAFIPQVAHVVAFVADNLLNRSAHIVGTGLDALVMPWDELVHAMLVPLVWAFASGALAYVSFRRASL